MMHTLMWVLSISAFLTGFAIVWWLIRHVIPVVHVHPEADGTVFVDDKGTCYKYNRVDCTCPMHFEDGA